LQASIFEKQEKVDKAIEIIRQALTQFPKEERLIYYLGALYDKQGDTERALSVMQDILKANPKNPDALNYVGYTYVTQKQKLDEAEALIKKALALKPGEGYVEDSLGWLYYVQGKYKKAKDILEKAVQMRSDEAVILDHLADTYLKLGETEKAYLTYQKAMNAKPDRKTTDAIKQKLEKLSENEVIKKRFPAKNK
ncbi:MAG: tetratricopeptide repeat protein, partial [Deltaproteobacteria bacterium]|nr:tetratricopeptide repeat protein [Deltaproteobacteria bacterium]